MNNARRKNEMTCSRANGVSFNPRTRSGLVGKGDGMPAQAADTGPSNPMITSPNR
jgi:hypothetical protein